MTGLVILGVAVALILMFVGLYNGLVRLRNEVKNAWAQIDVQLKRRHDLIPNLVETVKGYMTHERETFEAITRARSGAMSAQATGNVGQIAQAEGVLTGALRGFYAVAENYPQLKADANFRQLQEELTSTENKVSFARQFYNDAVLKYNTACETIPSNIVAGIGGFKKAEFFEIKDEAERAVPQVKF
ncbi:MAG: LemA family protein [Kiritimatiellae bacterium]|nr:LemA family protein [Kiritimatiellia bacterium]MCO5062407.1 LemA family protein [Kiritimatiellia bacterium]MCO6400623.1 LemA family protein [Verrucomicrobiota bacterium]